MDNTKKTPLEEAKANFEQIKKFATEAAKQEFEKEINEKIDKLIKESLTVEVDDENNITVSTDEKVIELSNDGEVEVEEKEKHEEELENGIEDNEEIEIEKPLDEMINLEQEQPILSTEPVVEPNENLAVEPVVETEDAITKLAKDLAAIINTAVEEKMGGQESSTSDQAVEYIDDDQAATEQPETSNTPVQTNAPAPVVQQTQPIQEEDDLLEFSINEIDENDFSNDLTEEESDYEKDGIKYGKDYLPELPQEVKIDEEIEFEFPIEDEDELEIEILSSDDEERENEPELEEMKGISKLVRNTSNRLGLEPRQGTPNLQESVNKIKALYESKLDELNKENKSLNESIKEMGDVISNYKSSFKDLRKQFDEMQTFNAKLAYANKIFASGGLSTSEKTKIAEDFDRTQNVDEAKNLYKKIIEENKISINKDNISKIKSATTNNIPSKPVVFESAELIRRKELAGIIINENYK